MYVWLEFIQILDHRRIMCCPQEYVEIVLRGLAQWYRTEDRCRFLSRVIAPAEKSQPCRSHLLSVRAFWKCGAKERDSPKGWSWSRSNRWYEWKYTVRNRIQNGRSRLSPQQMCCRSHSLRYEAISYIKCANRPALDPYAKTGSPGWYGKILSTLIGARTSEVKF